MGKADSGRPGYPTLSDAVRLGLLGVGAAAALSACGRLPVDEAPDPGAQPVAPVLVQVKADAGAPGPDAAEPEPDAGELMMGDYGPPEPDAGIQ